MRLRSTFLALPLLFGAGVVIFATSQNVFSQFPGRGEPREFLASFDADKSGWLNRAERKNGSGFGL